jgi:hypothetical protein
MKVKHLIKKLNELDPNMELVLQRDPEGNGYDDVSGIDGDCFWFDEDIYSTEWTAEEAGFDEDEWEDILSKVEKVAVIYP